MKRPAHHRVNINTQHTDGNRVITLFLFLFIFWNREMRSAPFLGNGLWHHLMMMRQAAFCWRFGCCYFSACWLSVPVVKNQNKKRREKKISPVSHRGRKINRKTTDKPPLPLHQFLVVSRLSHGVHGQYKKKIFNGRRWENNTRVAASL